MGRTATCTFRGCHRGASDTCTVYRSKQRRPGRREAPGRCHGRVRRGSAGRDVIVRGSPPRRSGPPGRSGRGSGA
ncbi:hypothetical protein [Nocardia sp. NPDC004722]